MDLKARENLENAALRESLESAAIMLFSNRYIERVMDLKALREPRKSSYIVLQQIYWAHHGFEGFERT